METPHSSFLPNQQVSTILSVHSKLREFGVYLVSRETNINYDINLAGQVFGRCQSKRTRPVLDCMKSRHSFASLTAALS